MKNFLLILFCFIAVSAGAQYIPNSTSYQWKGGEFLNSLQIPTGCGQPVTATNAPDTKRSAVYFDSCNNSFYKYDPKTQTWGPITGGGSAGVDTIFVRNDTLYGVKGGSEFYVTKLNIYNNGLNSGGYVNWSGSGLTFNVTAATYTINNITYNSAAGQVTLSPADATNPRYDVIAVDTLGHIVTVTGTPSANPSIPQVDPAAQIALTSVYLPAGATTPQILQRIIYDENTEPFTHVLTGGVTVNFDNTSNVYHGAKSMDVSKTTSTQNIDFVSGTGNDTASKYSMLTFYLKLKDTMATNGNIRFYFLNNTTVTGTGQLLTANNGLARKQKTTYQTIMVPISSFSFPASTVFNRVRITLTGTVNGFYADYLQLQNGAPPANTTAESDPVANNKTITVNGSTQKLNDNPVFNIAVSGSETDPVYSANGTPKTRLLTINGVAQDLSADRSWTIASSAPSLNSTQIGFGNASNLMTGSDSLTYPNNVLTIKRSNLASTATTNGLVLLNPTASTASVTVQNSPLFTLAGTAWNTSVPAQNVTSSWSMYVAPASYAAGAGAPTGSLLTFINNAIGNVFTYNSNGTFTGNSVTGTNIVQGGIGAFNSVAGASQLLAGGAYPSAAGTYRTTNAGSDITPQYYLAQINSSAGNPFFMMDRVNGLGFGAMNDATPTGRAVMRAKLYVTDLVNTAGSEGGGLGFATQLNGAAAAERMKLTPAGTLTLMAGTVSAAPFNIPTGVFRTVPVSGDIESDGNNLRWTNNSGVSVNLSNNKRIQAFTTASTVTPDINNNDAVKITALAGALTINAPTGTPAGMQELVIRILDNGTAQTLSWNAIYRQGADLLLPTITTAGKTMYLKFYYNSDANTWDFVSFLNGF